MTLVSLHIPRNLMGENNTDIKYVGPWLSSDDCVPIPDVENFYSDFWESYTKVEGEICNYCNRRFGVKELRYWRFIIYRWASIFVRRLCMLKYLKGLAEKRYGEITLVCFEPSVNLAEFFEHDHNTQLHHFNSSVEAINLLVIEAAEIHGWPISFVDQTSDGISEVSIKESWRRNRIKTTYGNCRSFLRLLYVLIRRIAKNDVSFVVPSVGNFRYSDSGRFKIPISYVTDFVTLFFNFHKARMWNDSENLDSLTRLCFRFIPSDIASVIETSRYRTTIGVWLRYFRADKCSVRFLKTAHDAVAVAEMGAEGTPIEWYQHGGAYGEYRFLDWDYLETALCDRYHRCRKTDVKHRIHPPGYVRSHSDVAPKTGGKTFILWLARKRTFFPTKCLDLSYESFRLTEEHIESIEPSVLGILRYRVVERVNSNLDLLIPPSIRQRSNCIEIDRGNVGIQNIIGAAKFVIIETGFSTSFHECLTLGLPCVTFCPNWRMFVRDDLAEIYTLLLRASVLVESYESLIRCINAFCNNPSSWLNDQDRRFAIERYANEFSINVGY